MWDKSIWYLFHQIAQILSEAILLCPVYLECISLDNMKKFTQVANKRGQLIKISGSCTCSIDLLKLVWGLLPKIQLWLYRTHCCRVMWSEGRIKAILLPLPQFTLCHSGRRLTPSEAQSEAFIVQLSAQQWPLMPFAAQWIELCRTHKNTTGPQSTTCQ